MLGKARGWRNRGQKCCMGWYALWAATPLEPARSTAERAAAGILTDTAPVTLLWDHVSSSAPCHQQTEGQQQPLLREGTYQAQIAYATRQCLILLLLLNGCCFDCRITLWVGWEGRKASRMHGTIHLYPVQESTQQVKLSIWINLLEAEEPPTLLIKNSYVWGGSGCTYPRHRFVPVLWGNLSYEYFRHISGEYQVLTWS